MRAAAALLLALSGLLSQAFGSGGGSGRQTPVPGVPASSAANYAFPSGAGMLFFYVKPDKTADFEAVTARLADLLDRTDDPVGKQQAAGWRVLKSLESTQGQTIYVFYFDPAVAGADYDPVKWLSRAEAADVQPLYAKLKDATIRVERMGLMRIR